MPRDNAALEEDLFAQLEAGTPAMTVVWLAPEQIEAPNQARKYFDPAKHKEMMASINSAGIQQPIQVRRVPGRSDQYLLISGERRLRAARELKFLRVPAIVVKATDYERTILNLIENIQRSNLRGGEEAAGVADFVRQIGGPERLAIQEASKRLGKPERYIVDRLKIAAAPPELLKALDKQPLASSSVLIALQLKERNHIRKAASLIADGASKREVQSYVSDLLEVERQREATRAELERRLEESKWTAQGEEVGKPVIQGTGVKVGGGVSRTEPPAADSTDELWRAEDSEDAPALQVLATPDGPSGKDYADAQNAYARAQAPVSAEILRDRARDLHLQNTGQLDVLSTPDAVAGFLSAARALCDRIEQRRAGGATEADLVPLARELEALAAQAAEAWA